MKALNRTTVPTTPLPIKILQFGEGNFLRAFADWMIDLMNENHGYNAGVAVVQPIAQGMTDMLRKQDNLYHHIYRGLQDGKATSQTRLISCIQTAISPFEARAEYDQLAISEDLEVVISNTTEAGIVYKADDQPSAGQLAETFPGKVTQLLWARYEHYSGDTSKGLKFIPVELIDKNGKKLKEAILNYASLWDLPAAFAEWVNTHNYFANTLVDRIVPGYPRDEVADIQAAIGFDDQLIVSSEVFHLWVIEGSKEIQAAFPADQCGLNVIYTKDLTPYRVRKVRILNGAHTSMVPVGLLNSLETVKETVEDEVVGAFVRQIIFDEIAPTIALPKAELEAYAEEVIERFRNPYIRHELKSISLNSISKYKVRVLPSLLDALAANGELPQGLVLALTHLIRLYLSSYEIQDDEGVKEYFKYLRQSTHSPEQIIQSILAKTEFWNRDLNQIAGLGELVTTQFEQLLDGATISDFLTTKA
ncbi:tagaturonate reductase [Reichenbachiella carrageenanivorans]|uniref:Tagaturonate reductase n=1 Tax=Reichenbachiella carrageenanivorans TaxID=2979869 RepID=A0ABY6D582_9BACT|nr:tagaturonate reductase [Reichenbachiella carrageenanivorans]UXX81317.1 tagaturonate reductase [Reichenbachiella carrageenanivorans]